MIIKNIPGFEGRYAATNEGQIWSFLSNQFLTLQEAGYNKNYYAVNLYIDENTRKRYFVHRLVALTFIPNPDNLPYINHKDENGHNNNVDNLEWCTTEYNNNYGSRTGRMIKTQQLTHPLCKKVICLETGEIFNSISEASRIKNIERTTLNRVVKNSRPEQNKTAGGFHWAYYE